MKPEDIIRYAAGPWSELERRKVEYWRERKERHGAQEALAVVEDLHRTLAALRPEERRTAIRADDLESHARVAAAFRRIAEYRDRPRAELSSVTSED